MAFLLTTRARRGFGIDITEDDFAQLAFAALQTMREMIWNPTLFSIEFPVEEEPAMARSFRTQVWDHPRRFTVEGFENDDQNLELPLSLKDLTA